MYVSCLLQTLGPLRVVAWTVGIHVTVTTAATHTAHTSHILAAIAAVVVVEVVLLWPTLTSLP